MTEQRAYRVRIKALYWGNCTCGWESRQYIDIGWAKRAVADHIREDHDTSPEVPA